MTDQLQWWIMPTSIRLRPLWLDHARNNENGSLTCYLVSKLGFSTYLSLWSFRNLLPLTLVIKEVPKFKNIFFFTKTSWDISRSQNCLLSVYTITFPRTIRNLGDLSDNLQRAVMFFQLDQFPTTPVIS